MNKDIKIIREKFEYVKKLGYVKTHRKGNTGIGKTFEDLLGIEENNLSLPDFHKFEIKSQRFLTGSFITLFTKKPTHPENANNFLREKYGTNEDSRTHFNTLHTSFYATHYNSYKEKYCFKLNLNRQEKKLYINIKNQSTNKIVSRSIYYTYDDLKKALEKLNYLFVVYANTKKENATEYFHFTKAKIFLNLSFSKFLNQLEKGNIQYDIRIGAYPDGKIHDHGSGFRVKRDVLDYLYKTNLEL